MKNVLVTGGAGFIGSNFINYILEEGSDYNIVNLDKLTYAGNLENLIQSKPKKNYHFVKGDICNTELVNYLFQKFDISYVINFAAESHVDCRPAQGGPGLLGSTTLFSRPHRISRRLARPESTGPSPWHGCDRSSSEASCHYQQLDSSWRFDRFDELTIWI